MKFSSRHSMFRPVADLLHSQGHWVAIDLLQPLHDAGLARVGPAGLGFLILDINLCPSLSAVILKYDQGLIAIEALGFRIERIRLAGYLPDQDLLSYLAVGRYSRDLVREFAETTRKTGIVRAGGLVAVDPKRGRKGDLGIPRHRHLHSGVIGVVRP